MPARTNFDRCALLVGICFGNRYIGLTNNLQERLKAHSEGRVFSTDPRRPFRLIYWESCLDKEVGRRRERHLKITGWRRFLVKRLKSYYAKR